jgi:type VI secretion system protein VasG
MLRGVVSVMEKHHRVQVLDAALEAAVKLSHRYIPDRQLPDKAISLLDTSCARVAVSHHATPAAVEDCQRRIEALQTELDILAREEAMGMEVGRRTQEVNTAIATETERLAALKLRWQEQKKLVDEILDLRARLRVHGPVDERAAAQTAAHEQPVAAAPPSPAAGQPPPTAPPAPAPAAAPPLTEAERTELRTRLRQLQDQLATLQGESPLVLPSVDERAVGSVVADWTGIPVGRMVKDEVAAVLSLATTLGKRVVGQDHALEMIARRVQTARAGLENPNKPIGVFMLAGPSGVGKTETALALAESLYGGEQNLITINMSEFQEAHTVSTLKGAPPGYVGYGEGGVLTEAVRRRPYSVVLLDEVEKAHTDVHEIFFQVFDKGVMEDGEGRLIDFKNTLIILTTNVGTDLIMGMCKDPELLPDPEGIAKALRQPLLKAFPPALLGRMVVIPYYPLSDEVLGRIIRLQLGRIAARVKAGQGIDFNYTDAVIELVAYRCTEPESGGRMIDAILTNSVLPRVSQLLLEKIGAGAPPTRVEVDVAGSEFTYVVT